MPVQSKVLPGRAKKPPPIPAPKPILKTPKSERVPPSPTWSNYHRQSPQPMVVTPSSPNRGRVRLGFQDPLVERASSPEVEWLTRGEKEEAVGLKGGSPSQRSRTNRTPLRLALGGEWALKECEEHTDWANDILRQTNLPLLTDLRKRIGDGFTLPTLIEIISNSTLRCVKVRPETKEDCVENLEKCLKFLRQKLVDVSGIQASDLQDGNLKSILLLIGNIRKVFDPAYSIGLPNGTITGSQSPEALVPNHSPTHRMPGTIKIPGAVPTPFLQQRDPSPVRKDLAGSPTRRSMFPGEDFIPGSMSREPAHSTSQKPHPNLISSTQLSNNGVSQHGVEERRQHIVGNSYGSRVSGPLPGNQATGAQGEPSLPQGAIRAWSASPRPQQHGNKTNGSSLEGRLQNLINSGGLKDKPPLSNSLSASRDSMGNGFTGVTSAGGGGGGGYNVDDGEILIVPPPLSRNSPDFDLMIGTSNHGYGPGYRSSSMTPQPMQQRSNRSYGYVPSKPSERWQGSRSEAILDRQTKPSPVLLRASRQSGAPKSIPGVPTLPGQEQYGLNPETQLQQPASSKTVANTEHKPPTQGGPTAGVGGGNDLRSAWNKLYGQSYSGPTPQPLTRGDNLRSSYGPQTQVSARPHNVKFAPSPTPLHTSRPPSAPVIDHSRGPSHDTMDTSRSSPLGQSSSTQGQLEGSSSSQISGASQGGAGKGQLTFDSFGKSSASSLSSPNSPVSPNSQISPNYAIGPAAKYPELGSRPSSGKSRLQGQKPGSPVRNVPEENNHKVTHNNEKSAMDNFMKPSSKSASSSVPNKGMSDSLRQMDNKLPDRKTAFSGGYRNQAFSYSFDERDMGGMDAKDSIFDYNEGQSESSSRSVTPPLPPLSPDNTPPESPNSTQSPSTNLPRSLSATNVSAFKAPDLLKPVRNRDPPRRTSELQFRLDNTPPHQSARKKGFPQRAAAYQVAKGASKNEIRETMSDTESNLSFDIDDTILTVESHDTEQLPHMVPGEVLTTHEAAALRQQLHTLQSKYDRLQQRVEDDPGPLPLPLGRTRRWSIGSSDTNSFRRETKYKPGKHAHHRHKSREFKTINKRFQRLESHVVTLARSVAHLSSELRTHNTMVNDLEAVKRELRELKEAKTGPQTQPLGSNMTEMERFRGWVPSLTNPKRVNKLTKFFGTEPPLLELFLKKLGYERYTSNFQTEHIGMIELPYMTEDRLEKIGVPMGPRMRILQEAQLCFRHENLNIYIV